eukprot:2557330-Prymnesium_polylepis.1
MHTDGEAVLCREGIPSALKVVQPRLQHGHWPNRVHQQCIQDVEHRAPSAPRPAVRSRSALAPRYSSDRAGAAPHPSLRTSPQNSKTSAPRSDRHHSDRRAHVGHARSVGCPTG